LLKWSVTVQETTVGHSDKIKRKKKRKKKTCLAGPRKSSILLYYVWATSAVVTMHRQRSLCARRADPIRPSTVQFTTRDVPCITRIAPSYVIVLRSRSIINIIYTHAYGLIHNYNISTLGECEDNDAVNSHAIRTFEASVIGRGCYYNNNNNFFFFYLVSVFSWLELIRICRHEGVRYLVFVDHGPGPRGPGRRS